MLYSNFGYNLLGDIVRRVSGQPFWQFVRSRIFEPLGMADSHLVLPPPLPKRRVYRAPSGVAQQVSDAGLGQSLHAGHIQLRDVVERRPLKPLLVVLV